MEILTQCRCCLSPGSHRSLFVTYTWFDTKEVYSDMLYECFNIVLSAPSLESSAICENCINSLRESLSFKTQVVRSEQEFLKKLESDKKIEKPKSEVKLEPYFETDDIDFNEAVSDTATENADCKAKPQLAIKKKIKKRKISTKSSKCISIKLNGSDDIKKELELEKKEVKSEVDSLRASKTRQKKSTSNKRIITIDECKDNNDITFKELKSIVKTGKIIIKKNPVNLMWTSTKSSCDKQKHIHNLQTVLQCSNATPFKTKSLLGYICGYCDSTYPDPIDLRIHTGKDHKKERLNFKTTFDLTEYSVKLDIVDLCCTLCEEKFNNLSLLKTHLVKSHNKMFHEDIKDHILQFKLIKGDVYDCAMCTAKYETFKTLQQHMNSHCSNYKCKICEATFATKRSLHAHGTTHENGSFKCDHCDKIFTSKSKKQYHQRNKHLGSRSVGNCPYCNEPFRSYYQRNSHLIKVHNSEAPYKCNVCNKPYILRSLLMYHIKKSHLMERNFQCTQCGYKFFSKKALNAHMVKHTGERKYLCEVCHKSYARKYTLREHLRIHNNDRRFRCDVCALTFVQKCSLKSHLLSNHGISMAACEIKRLDE